MTEAGARARIVLAEDHALSLAQAVRILGGDYDVVGTASSGADLLKSAARLHPDVIVLDVSMPDFDGFEAARRLRAAHCASHLVFLSVWDDEDYAHDAMDVGADGYVLRSRLATDLAPAVAAALEGGKFVSPTAAMQGL